MSHECGSIVYQALAEIFVAQSFQVYGPYKIDRKKLEDKKWQKSFWDLINADLDADLANAKGAYVFSLRHGKKFTPLYVGMTMRSFRSEVFALHNVHKILTKWQMEVGSIEIHLLAKPKNVHSGFSINLSKDMLEALEVLLIFMCRRSNKKLINKKNIKWLDDIGILGITGTEKQKGKPKASIHTFKRVLKW